MISSANEFDYATGLEFVRYDKLNQKTAAPFSTHLKSDSGVTACFFFGVVNKQGTGLMQQKRIIIIGSTALYQCGAEADINRCVPIREIAEVIVAPDNWIGLRIPAEGVATPPAHDFGAVWGIGDAPDAVTVPIEFQHLFSSRHMPHAHRVVVAPRCVSSICIALVKQLLAKK